MSTFAIKGYSGLAASPLQGGLFHSKFNGFVPHTQHINMKIVCEPLSPPLHTSGFRSSVHLLSWY